MGWPSWQSLLDLLPSGRVCSGLLCSTWYAFSRAARLAADFCCSVTQSHPTLCDPTDCSLPGFPALHYLQSLLKLMSTESIMPSNHLVLCHPLLLLPAISPSIRVFSNKLAFCIRCLKDWSFSFTTGSSNEYSWLISFGVDWFDLLDVQGTHKIFSSTTVQKKQFLSTQSSLWSYSHICT